MSTQKLIQYPTIKSNGQSAETALELNLAVSEKVGNYLLHRDLLRQHNSLKQGTFSTKTRSEVRGGGRKPWQQKGTGRARAGSNRSPLWKGGGVIFGPKPKQVNLKLNKKERRLALQTLLFNKKRSITVIEDLETTLVSSKTQHFSKICADCKINTSQRLLIVVSYKTQSLKRTTQNLKNVELLAANNLNTVSLLKANRVIITLPAIQNIKETYCD